LDGQTGLAPFEVRRIYMTLLPSSAESMCWYAIAPVQVCLHSASMITRL
jgi:hypothetical protein